jgi:(p)ppGpp synthase/HD superfamily hydrolase
MSDLQSAILISAQAHHGQKRKNGLPYLLHPFRVMLRMKTEKEMIVAILHDVVEDTAITLDDLRSKGFFDDVLAALDLLTKKKGQAYEEYIGLISRNPLARAVKIADLEDNMNLGELPRVREKDLARNEKYRKALLRLQR